MIISRGKNRLPSGFSSTPAAEAALHLPWLWTSLKTQTILLTLKVINLLLIKNLWTKQKIFRSILPVWDLPLTQILSWAAADAPVAVTPAPAATKDRLQNYLGAKLCIALRELLFLKYPSFKGFWKQLRSSYFGTIPKHHGQPCCFFHGFALSKI